MNDPLTTSKACAHRRRVTVIARMNEAAGKKEAASVAWPDGKAAEETKLARATAGGRACRTPFGATRGETADGQRDNGSHRQPLRRAAPPQPQREIDAVDEERHEAPDRAEAPSRLDEPVGAVLGEPGQHSLVMRDESVAVRGVFSDRQK